MPTVNQLFVTAHDGRLPLDRIHIVSDFINEQPLVAEVFKNKENLFLDINFLKSQKRLNKKFVNVLEELDDWARMLLADFNNIKIPNQYKFKTSSIVLEVLNNPIAYKADSCEPLNEKDKSLGVPDSIGNDNFKSKDFEWIENFDNNYITNNIYKTTLFLNEDLKGGETTFPNQQIDIEPKTGKFLFHPCSRDYIYGVRPIDGVRFSLASFYQIVKNN